MLPPARLLSHIDAILRYATLPPIFSVYATPRHAALHYELLPLRQRYAMMPP